MSTTNLAKLHLPHLKYDVADIQKTINLYPDLDCFMFLQNFNASSDSMPALHLLSYAHGNTGKGTPEYHEVYYNGNNPDMLTPFDDKLVKLDAPVILVPNGVSQATIKELIEGDETPDALIFIPHINDARLIFYKIKPAKIINGEYVFIIKSGDPETDTNPSPPATIESLGR